MKPVAKKATAAELRNKARMSMPCVCEDYCRCDVTTVVDDDALDEILAAARAEAVAPLEARVAELESERGALVEADILRRARVGEVLDVLRQFAEAMPKCDRCGAPAFSECYQYPRPSPIPYCPLCGPESGRHKLPHQDPLRAALALLAADQADEKAGKP